MTEDAFSRFEHEGWARVADKHDSVWATSTRQFIPPLLDTAAVATGMPVLDVGCGPGYVSAAAAGDGAKPTGLDFSKQMIAIAKQMFPQIEFREGDAQNLPFADASFDRVLANFALLHLADPERACAEAFRVLRSGGKFGFTVWAPPSESPYARIIDDAIQAYADVDVDLPAGPPHYLFARYIFDTERNAGVRTAGLLARQTPANLGAIQAAIEDAVRPYSKGHGAIPKAAYVIVISKR